MEWIFSRPNGAMDEGHQDIADHGAVLGFEEEAIFSVEDAAFNESLDNIVGKWSSGHPQKERQLRPSPLHIVNGLTEPTIGLGLSTLDLVAAPGFECISIPLRKSTASVKQKMRMCGVTEIIRPAETQNSQPPSSSKIVHGSLSRPTVLLRRELPHHH